MYHLLLAEEPGRLTPRQGPGNLHYYAIQSPDQSGRTNCAFGRFDARYTAPAKPRSRILQKALIRIHIVLLPSAHLDVATRPPDLNLTVARRPTCGFRPSENPHDEKEPLAGGRPSLRPETQMHQQSYSCRNRSAQREMWGCRTPLPLQAGYGNVSISVCEESVQTWVSRPVVRMSRFGAEGIDRLPPRPYILCLP